MTVQDFRHFSCIYVDTIIFIVSTFFSNFHLTKIIIEATSIKMKIKKKRNVYT